MHHRSGLFRVVKLKPYCVILFISFACLVAFSYSDHHVYYKLLHADQPCFPTSEQRRDLIYLLQTVADELTNLNITWWLSDGSLLGAFRYKNLLPWDYDGDIGYAYKDEKTLQEHLPNALKRFNFNLQPKVGKFATYEVIYNNLHVDLYAYAPFAEVKNVHSAPLAHYTDATMASMYEPTDFYFRKIGHCRRSNVEHFYPLKPCQFAGKSMICPNDPDTILRRHYCFSYWLPFSFSYKFDCYIKPWNLWTIIRTPWEVQS